MKGFTFLEIIFVMALVPLFFSILSYGFLDLYQKYLLKSEKELLVNLIIKARNRASVNYLQMPHGISWQDPNNYLLFIGTSSSQRLSQYDEYFPRSNLVKITAPFNEITFFPLSLQTNASGTIMISVQDKNEKIDINYEGRLVY